MKAIILSQDDLNELTDAIENHLIPMQENRTAQEHAAQAREWAGKIVYRWVEKVSK